MALPQLSQIAPLTMMRRAGDKYFNADQIKGDQWRQGELLLRLLQRYSLLVSKEYRRDRLAC
ncbi:hypothetical protein KU74_12960 [Pectobacterium brasiliense]|uniref:Uncharacterized protein n=1 Tax=Pectobacterium brasiliense TaxID=180957 RepID=A0A0M2F303_9GAMM|nr:hypothetical protein KU74_12960 [Pectobacterium brasiliense]